MNKSKIILICCAFSAAILTGCGKSVDVSGKGMYANATTGALGIGVFEVETDPAGVESANVRYWEDSSWLFPQEITHNFKIVLKGTNSVLSAVGIVEALCETLSKTNAVPKAAQ